MSKLNILEICLSPDLGGLELFMVHCFEYFNSKANCKLIIAPDTKLDDYIITNNKSYIKRNKLFPIKPALALAKFIDRNHINIVHFHWTKDIATVVLARHFSKRKPKIIQTRNMTMTRFKSDFYHRWLYKNIDTIHAVTFAVKSQLEKFIPSDIRPNIEVVYMGTKEKDINSNRIISLREQYNLTDIDTFIVGIVGRIEEAKGQYLVIEAIAKLKDLNIKAMIVGHTMDKRYLNSLKKKIKKLDIEDRFIFTGFTKDVDTHMQLFDVNVLATPNETFGLVVIEAMMNDVCVIATNVGGPLEIIEDGKDGLHFDRTSEDLSKKIKLLYDDKDLKSRLAYNGYKKAKKMFDYNKQLEKLYEVIEGM